LFLVTFAVDKCEVSGQKFAAVAVMCPAKIIIREGGTRIERQEKMGDSSGYDG